MTSDFTISIVIPTYNRAGLLGPSLDSILAMDVPEGSAVETIVIDNNCTDGTADVVREKAQGAPWAVRHVVETRQGLCFGRNRGLEEAAHEYLVYLDDDIRVDRRWLTAFVEAIERFGAECVVGPVTPVFEREVPGYMTQRIIDSIGSAYSRKGEEPYVLGDGESHETPGCNFGVRRAVAQEIGGFNPKLDRVGDGLLAGGDTEFGMRLARAGKRVAYEPRCSIEHLITSDKLKRSYLRKRWRGLGATKRALDVGSIRLPARRRLRYAFGAARLLVQSGMLRWRGETALAFQRELEARRSWAFLRSRYAGANRIEATRMNTS